MQLLVAILMGGADGSRLRRAHANPDTGTHANPDIGAHANPDTGTHAHGRRTPRNDVDCPRLLARRPRNGVVTQGNAFRLVCGYFHERLSPAQIEAAGLDGRFDEIAERLIHDHPKTFAAIFSMGTALDPSWIPVMAEWTELICEAVDEE